MLPDDGGQQVSTTTVEAEPDVDELDIVNQLEPGKWLKIPMAAMREKGIEGAAQTLGGFLALTTKQTFSSVERIAEWAGLPVTTVRKHLKKLVSAGWLTNIGRGHDHRGRPRRTCTYRITKKTLDSLSDYGVLPRWADVYKMSWPAKCVLCVVMRRLMGAKAAVERNDGMACMDAGDVAGSLPDMGGNARFRFSLSRLERETGRSRASLAKAKRELANLKIISWEWAEYPDGKGYMAHSLYPNFNFSPPEGQYPGGQAESVRMPSQGYPGGHRGSSQVVTGVVASRSSQLSGMHLSQRDVSTTREPAPATSVLFLEKEKTGGGEDASGQSYGALPKVDPKPVFLKWYLTLCREPRAPWEGDWNYLFESWFRAVMGIATCRRVTQVAASGALELIAEKHPIEDRESPLQWLFRVQNGHHPHRNPAVDENGDINF